MRFLLLVIIGGVLFTSPFLSPLEIGNAEYSLEKKQEIKVMSYNIHHANPPSKKDSIDLPAIISSIKEQQPELIALQEIDVNTNRSGNGNQAKIIADKLGMHVFFGKAIDFDNGEYGVAILSKYPLLEEKIHKLPTKSGTGGEPRVLAMVKIALPNGNIICFGSTHLDAQRENSNRLLQTKEIIRITSTNNYPTIIAGDFNDVPGSEVVDILDKHFKRTCRDCSPTIPVETPMHAIDFIAFKPQENFNTIEHKVLNETYASDHLPIVATMAIKF